MNVTLWFAHRGSLSLNVGQVTFVLSFELFRENDWQLHQRRVDKIGCKMEVNLLVAAIKETKLCVFSCSCSNWGKYRNHCIEWTGANSYKRDPSIEIRTQSFLRRTNWDPWWPLGPVLDSSVTSAHVYSAFWDTLNSGWASVMCPDGIGSKFGF